MNNMSPLNHQSFFCLVINIFFPTDAAYSNISERLYNITTAVSYGPRNRTFHNTFVVTDAVGNLLPNGKTLMENIK